MADRTNWLRFNASPSNLHRGHVARRRLAVECLETRRLLSVDTLISTFDPFGLDIDPHYFADGYRIGLDFVEQEYAIKISNPDADNGLAQLLAVGGTLEGFQVDTRVSGSVYLITGRGLGLDSLQDDDLAWITPSYTSESTGDKVLVLDEVVVAIEPGVNPKDVFGTDVVLYRPLLGTPDQFVVTLDEGGQAALNYANNLIKNEQVAWAIPNLYQNMHKMFTLNDPLFPTQWHLNNTGAQVSDAIEGADIEALAAWDISTGTGVTIAVLDDGIQRAHPDLAGNIFVNAGEIASNGIDDDGNGWIDDISGWSFVTNSPDPSIGIHDIHGTSVAGVAAAAGNNGLGVSGSALNAKILPVQIFDGDYYVSDAATASAIYYAAGRTADGLGTWNAAQVLNCSWGGGSSSTTLTEAFTWASNMARDGKGVTTFISSGNDYYDSVNYPASLSSTLSGVMAVGASNQRDLRSEYSNYGTALDCVAPSSDSDSPYTVGITTTDRTGSFGYNSGDYTDNTVSYGFGGTSSASPLAAGVGALLLSADPSLTAAQVRQILRDTADKVGGVVYDASGFNLEYGYGRINAFAALQQLGLSVIGTLPANGAIVNSPPTPIGGYQVDFSQPYSPSLDDIVAGGFQINGVSANSTTIIDENTLQFNFDVNPVIAQGVQNLTLDSGTVKRLSDGNPLRAYTGIFYYDIRPLAVSDTLPVVDSLITLPLTTFDVHFNETIEASSVQASDFVLNQGSVTDAVPLDGETVRLTINGLVSEGALILSIAAGLLTDIYDNPNVPFLGSYVLDVGTVSYPVTLLAKPPLGSLVYDSDFLGSIHSTGETDTFTIDLDAGQTISVAVTASETTLRPVIEVYDPSNVLLGMEEADSPGQSVLLNTLPANTAGTYRLVIGGAGGTTGGYSTQLILNAALEREELFADEGNNTLATAQDIDASFINLSGAAFRGAVLGGAIDNVVFLPSDIDVYSFSLDQGETATIVLEAMVGAADGFQIRNIANHLLATSVAGPSNVDQVISHFTASAAGTNTYYVVVTPTTAYNLVVTRNATFELEANDSFTEALDVSGFQCILGSLEPESGTITEGFEAGNFSELPWVTSGDAVWYVTSETSANGSYSARAGNIYDYQSSTLSIVQTTIAGNMSFAHRVSSELGWDFLLFFIDAELVGAWSGIESTFITESFPVTDGTHTFTWSYTKDGIYYDGLDTAFIDEVVFPMAVVPQDWYQISVNAGDYLMLWTSTPGGATGEFVNTFDPQLELYDPDNQLITNDTNGGDDGRNAHITCVATQTGFYRVRVTAEDDTFGEYEMMIDRSPLALTVPSEINEIDGGAVDGMIEISGPLSEDLVVSIVSSAPDRITVPASLTIPAGETSVPLTMTITNDFLLQGPEAVTITASVEGIGYGARVGRIEVHDDEMAVLFITLPASATEGDGVGVGTILSTAAPIRDVLIQLTSSDTSEVAVPASIVLPADQTSVAFDITIIDDTIIDGVQIAAVTAHVENWMDGAASMAVFDNDRALVVTLPTDAWEGEGTLAGSGKVTIGGPMPIDLVATLHSDNTSGLEVPAMVTILAGQTSATFDVTIVDDPDRDGAQTAMVTASVPSFDGASAACIIHDNELDRLAWDTIASPQTAGVAFTATIRAKNVDDETIEVYDETVPLRAVGLSGNLPVTPGGCLFIAGTWNGDITINGVDSNVVLTVDDGAGHVANSNAFHVTCGPLDHFQWSTIDSPQYVNGLIPVTLMALDANGYTVTDFNEIVNLSGWTGITMNTIKITECGENTPDYVEIQNVSGHPVDTTGWIVALNDAEWSNINSVHDVVWNLPSLMSSSEVLYRTDDVADNYWGSNIWWGGGTMRGWAMIVDNAGAIVDFAVWGYSDSEIAGMSVVINGYLITIGSEWTGIGVTFGGTDDLSLQRFGDTDNNILADFSWIVRSKGTQNTGLTVPFPGSMSGVAIAPTATGIFVDGVWTGDVVVFDEIADMYLRVDDGSGHITDSNTFDVVPLTMALDIPTDAAEGGGPVVGTVEIPARLGTDLVVDLMSSNPSRVSVPGSVTILAGQTSAIFDVQIVDNTVLDGMEEVTVTATAQDSMTDDGILTVHDDETAMLFIGLPAIATEGDGLGAGTIMSTGKPTRDIVIHLTSSHTSEVAVPATVVLPAGQSSVAFDVTIIDDTVIDGVQIATITATVENWIDGTANMVVFDNDRTLAISLLTDAWEGEGTRAGSGMVAIGGTLPVDLVVTLHSDDTSELEVPATVTILAGQTSAMFDATIVDDLDHDGAQTATVTACIPTFEDATAACVIHDNELNLLEWDTIASPQTAGVAF
ncbi:MAG: S8 family serine peptidase, partial [Pirellulales bacterium]|nr:S8 family serine peptidase [Pirellulales bacterium]